MSESQETLRHIVDCRLHPTAQSVKPAKEIVAEMVREAYACLQSGSSLIGAKL